MLLAKDSDGKTIWHLALASQWQELGVWQKIWEWAKEYLTTEEMKKELLLATESDRKKRLEIGSTEEQTRCTSENVGLG